MFQEISPFTQQLATVTTEMESLSHNNLTGKITPVQIVSKTFTCVSCKKKVLLKSLIIFHQEVTKLCASVPDINLKIISEEQLMLSLLDVEYNFCIKNDTASNKLLDGSLEAI